MHRINPLVPVVCLFSLGLAQPAPVGQWTFDNSASLTHATIGSDLVLTGSQLATAGPDTGDGAALIGVGSYYRVTHGIAANGGGTMVNQWSLVIDFRVASIGAWHCFYQTDPTNASDGDCFISAGGTIGVGSTGYTASSITGNTWYRLAVVVSNGSRYEVYLNGSLVMNGTANPVDGRFALAPTMLLFADNDGEDDDITVAQVRLYGSALSASDVAALGSVHVGTLPPDTTSDSVAGWPTYRHDARRSAHSGESVTLPLYLQWVYKARHAPAPAWPGPAKVDICHGILTIPDQMAFDRAFYVVSAQGKAYFGSSADDKVVCLDAATGREQWSFFAEGPVRFAPVLSNNRLLFGSDDGSAYCLDTASGSQVWRYAAASPERKLPGNRRMVSSLPIRTDVIVTTGLASFGAGICEANPTMAGLQSRRISLSPATGSLSASALSSQMLQGHTVQQADGSVLWPAGQSGRPFTPNATLHFEADGATITVGTQTITGGQGLVQAGAWSAAVRGKVYALAFADGRLFASTDSGYIYCFGASAPARVDTVSPASAAMRYTSSSVRDQYAAAAQRILATSGVDRGYCLVLQSQGGHLAYELAAASHLTVVCVEADSATAAASRRALDSAGVYGRVSVQRFAGATLPYTDASFNIVTVDGYATGQSYAGQRSEVLRVLRPYGGMAFLGSSGSDIVSRGAVANAGEWTHSFGNTQNNPASGDAYVGTQVALQWYGEPGPNNQMDRDFKVVPPLWKDGVVVVPGNQYVTAVDAYNGALLWERSMPKSSRMPGFRDAGHLATQADYVYIAADDTCRAIGLRSGVTQMRFGVPTFGGGVRYAWGYVATVGDALFGSVEDTSIARDVTTAFENAEMWVKNPPWPVSEHLFALNRYSGAELWRYTPTGVVINSTIAIDNGTVFFLESTNSTVRPSTRNRFPLSDLLGGANASLVALNTATGTVRWRQSLDLRHVTDLVYLTCPEGRILFCGVYYDGSSTLAYDVYGFSQADGSQSWKTTIATGSTDIMHGAERGHPVVVSGVAYFVAGPSIHFAVNIATGQQVTWNFSRAGWGCGTVSASATHLFYRGGNASAWSLAQNSNTQLTSYSRPGCYINTIPAGGLINIPESSSGCTCGGYPMQTSMAFRTTLPLDAPTATAERRVRRVAGQPRLFLIRSANTLAVNTVGMGQGCRLRLSILNLAGREVFKARGVSQGEAHSYTFVWNCRNAGAGTYVLRLQAGEQRVERSVTLVK